MAGLGLVDLAIAWMLAPAALPAGGSLEFRAPAADCPDAAHVAGLLREHTGDVAVHRRLHAEAEARPLRDGSWTIELRTRIENGESTTRSFRVESCEAGGQAVALALAIVIAPDDHAPTPVTETEPAPTGAADGAPPPIPAPPPAPDDLAPPAPEPASGTEPAPTSVPTSSEITRARPRLRALVSVSGGVTGGVLPRLGGLVAGSVGISGRRFRVLARVEHEIRHVFVLDARPVATGRLSILGGALEAGPVFAAGPVELPVTVGVAAAGIRAVGDGGRTNATRVVPWAGLLAGMGVLWPATARLAIGARAELTVALVRRSFGFAPGFTLVRTGWVGGRALAVVEVRLP